MLGPPGPARPRCSARIAGIWPFGSGRIERPPRERMLFVPQRAYLPLGTLRAAVSYPAPETRFDDARIREALGLVGLGATRRAPRRGGALGSAALGPRAAAARDRARAAPAARLAAARRGDLGPRRADRAPDLRDVARAPARAPAVIAAGVRPPSDRADVAALDARRARRHRSAPGGVIEEGRHRALPRPPLREGDRHAEPRGPLGATGACCR